MTHRGHIGLDLNTVTWSTKILKDIGGHPPSPYDLVQPKENFCVVYLVKACLIMFFGNLRLRFFKISWLDFEQYENNQWKTKELN